MPDRRDEWWVAFKAWSDATGALKAAVLALEVEQPTNERKRELAQDAQRTLAAFVSLAAP